MLAALARLAALAGARATFPSLPAYSVALEIPAAEKIVTVTYF